MFTESSRTARNSVRLLIGLVLIATSGAYSAERNPRSETLTVIDVMPAFWAFQDEARSMNTSAEAVQRFRREIVEPHRRIYSHPQFKKSLTDDGIAGYLEEVASDLPVMRSLSEQIGRQTLLASEKFRRAFPRFRGDVTVAYLPSFYRFDGQLANLDGERVLLFGLDGIARYHGADADLRVLFSHELFHIHHSRVTPSLFVDEENAPLYVNVWIEGLATYVSERLNPQASTLQILLDDRSLLERGMPMIGRIAAMVMTHLDSTSDEHRTRFLSFGEQDGIPGRTGYLLGYAIAKRLGERYSLPELAALEGEKLRSSVCGEISQLAIDADATASGMKAGFSCEMSE